LIKKDKFPGNKTDHWQNLQKSSRE